MKLVIQRVNSASVSVKETGNVVGKIDKGLFALVGVRQDDTLEHSERLAEKLLKLRIMADPPSPEAAEGRVKDLNRSVVDVKGEILIVSQFTLYGNTKDGNRPSFIEAAAPEVAKEVYEYFVNKLKESGLRVETGQFGEYMNIRAELDGPVTIVVEQ